MIINSINLPQEAFINIETCINHVLENPNLDKLGINILSNELDSISIAYTLNDDSTTMSSFQNDEQLYQEIPVIRANITNTENGPAIAKALFRATAPSPVVIQLHCDGQYLLAVDFRNKSQDANCTAWINSDDISSKDVQFLNSLHYDKLLSDNLFTFYQAIGTAITRYNASLLVDDLATDDTRIADIVTELKLYDKEIDKLMRKIKKTSQFNLQVRLAKEIDNLKEKKEKLALELGT